MIDSHCHLAGEEFVADLGDVVQRATAAGVEGALVILAADDQPEISRARAVSECWPGVRFSTGIHPHAAGRFAADPAGAARAVTAVIDAQPLTRAIGEIGLDYHYDFAPRDVQQQVFREQIRLARERRLPIVIHTREATDDTFAILAEESASGVTGVFHCFTGDRDMAARALAIGFDISLAGIVTFANAIELREVARSVPLDRLLIETDSPFLTPAPFRKQKRNEPHYVARVAEVIADVRGETVATIRAATTANYERLFSP